MSEERGESKGMYYKKVHTAESGKARNDRRRASFTPRGCHLPNAPLMEKPRAI